MRERFGTFAEAVVRRLFSKVVIHESAVEKIRELSSRGTVVLVLRHRSLLDYLLVNEVLRREKLPLADFANGVSLTRLSSVGNILRRFQQLLFSSAGAPLKGGDYCVRTVEAGRPVLVFMRGRRRRSLLGRLRGVDRGRVGSDYLRDILASRRDAERETFIVPLALFRGHSFRRREGTFSALVYNVHDVPSEFRKLLTYWWNRNNLFVTVGTEVGIRKFASTYVKDDEDRLLRRLTRAIQIFMHREERVVLGPALQPLRKVRQQVLENDDTLAEIERIADERGVAPAKVAKEAEGYFREMAANFNGVTFAILGYISRRIWTRMLNGIEPIGLEKVIEKIRHHPVVLVPCHRSHLDYLIISYLCYLNFVSPPHIAAGVNMSFWPMGPVFRGAGAFFIRRTFGDNEVYKLVFRQYLTFLIREGYTQEFFIEGGRSRTGKILTPKLGMLTGIIDAYLGGVRRDLYLVPVSIHYGRIVEEDAYEAELSGGDKEPESFAGLMRARRFLSQKFGTIYVSFADPISLRDTLGEDRERFSEADDDPEIAEEKRRFIQKMGFRILKDVNETSVAGATSVSATVLLGAASDGYRYEEFRAQANELAELIRFQGIRPTSSLARNIGDFRESMSFLSQRQIIEITNRGREEAILVPQEKRLALDFYKNNLIHAFLMPSLVCYCILEEGGIVPEDTSAIARRVGWWLDFFRWEFALPEREDLLEGVDRFVGYYRERGAIGVERLDESHPLVDVTANILESFREVYYVVARTIYDELPEEGMPEKALRAAVQAAHKTSMRLGEVSKPESASMVTIGNALNRYCELGLIAKEKRGRGGREVWILRGDQNEKTLDTVDLLARSLRLHQVTPQLHRIRPAAELPEES